jgi:hypothetical protein
MKGRVSAHEPLCRDSQYNLAEEALVSVNQYNITFVIS